MAWIPALAALPSIYQMMQPSPGAPPPNPAANVALPDVSNYRNQILQSGFNPQSDLYRIASQQAMGSVNSDLANKGLGFSSYGNQAVADAQTKLANSFLQNELQRRISAFNAATGYDATNADVRFRSANAGYGSAMNGYNAGVNQNQQTVGDISNIMGAGLNAYSGYQSNQRADATTAQSQANFDRLMNYITRSNTPSPTGGTVSTTPGGP